MHGQRTYGFTFLDNCKHGANLVIQALHEVVLDQLLLHGKLPCHLLLQLDNTTKQNKNRFVIGYCAWLVQRGVFTSVKISFLPVGHTHEDIDQVFSRVHIKLRQQIMWSRRDFKTLFCEAFKHDGEQLVLIVAHLWL